MSGNFPDIFQTHLASKMTQIPKNPDFFTQPKANNKTHLPQNTHDQKLVTENVLKTKNKTKNYRCFFKLSRPMDGWIERNILASGIQFLTKFTRQAIKS